MWYIHNYTTLYISRDFKWFAFLFSNPRKYIDILALLYADISKILKYDSIQIRLGCAIQSLSSKNMFYDFICTHELLHFLCVRKNTIMVKLQKYKKILLNQNILNNV